MMSTRELVKKLERQLKRRPGVVQRIVRAEQATADDLEDPMVLVVTINTVTKEGQHDHREA
ncbi:MAG: hypothetical protein ACUVX9_15030 [Anaerolineae bacterium]